MINFVQQGDFSKSDKFFEKLLNVFHKGTMDTYGEMGVEALRAATPVRTGKTAASWTYEIDRSSGKTSIVWANTNVNNGENVALLIQMGHGTGSGGYVQGRDYINPAIKPIYDEIAKDIDKEVSGK